MRHGESNASDNLQGINSKVDSREVWKTNINGCHIGVFVSGGFEKIVEDPDSRPFCVMESRMPQTSYTGLTQTLTVERYGTQKLMVAPHNNNIYFKTT